MSGAADRRAPSMSNSEPDLASHARHRMANLFQLLTTLTRMRIQRARGEEARLWSADGEDFSGFLEEMRPIWKRRCAGRRIEVEVEAAAVKAPEQLASALSLIVHELVGNAIDHGFVDGRAGHIRVRLEMIDGARACLTVSDDGQGYDPASLAGETLGLWLVQGLTAQLRGVLTTTTTDGVTARLEFPNDTGD